MSNKEILLEILKHTLGDRLMKLEQRDKEEESSLKIIKTSYDDFSKRISGLVKLREEKISKDKAEEIKKHGSKTQDIGKAKKKEPLSKTNKRQNLANNLNVKKNIVDKTSEKKTNLQKTKSSANFNNKKLPERVRGKSIGRLQTEVSRNTIGVNPNINNIKSKMIEDNKKDKDKDNFLAQAPRRNTLGPLIKKHIRGSKSMGRLTGKPTLKKAINENNKKKEEVQKMVNSIKIENKEPKEEEKIDILPEIIPPPTLMTCHEKGILEKSILPFLTKKDKLELFASNKSLAKLNISILKDKVTSYKQIYEILIGETIDDKIKGLEEKYTQEELNEPIKNFELSRGALKAIGLLDDELYMRIFTRPVQEKVLDEIVIIYRIFSQFLGIGDLNEIKNDKKFWEKFSKYVLDNKGEKLSKFCSESANKFVFDNKNILKVKEMSKDISEKLKPKYWSKICATTGFFAFIIKDIVEYAGIVEDKKTQASRIKANYLYIKAQFEQLDKFINLLEGLQINSS